MLADDLPKAKGRCKMCLESSSALTFDGRGSCQDLVLPCAYLREIKAAPRASASPKMDCFDAETQFLIHHIHHAWKTKAALKEYALLRDRITSHQDRLDIQITALGAVVRLVLERYSVHEYSKDPGWRDFLALAAALQAEDNQRIPDTAFSPTTRGHTRNYNQISRCRNLAVIEALWSPEIVEYYGWSQAGQGQVRIIRTCAVQYPDFEADFSPRLNSVLLARHCLAIQHGQGRTINEAKLQPYKDFDVEILRTATIDHELVYQWVTNQDGTVRLGPSGTVLKDVRPEHFRLYLLQRDHYGILETRAQQEDSPNDVNNSVVPSISTEGSYAVCSFNMAMQSPSAEGAVHGYCDDTELQCDPVGQVALCLADVHSPVTSTASMDSSMRPVLREGRDNADVTMLSTPSCSVAEPDQRWSPLSVLTSDEMLLPSAALGESWYQPGLYMTRESSAVSNLRFSTESETSQQQPGESSRAAELQTATSAACSELYPAKRGPAVVRTVGSKRSRVTRSGHSVPTNKSSEFCPGQSENDACNAGLGSGARPTKESVRPVVSPALAVGAASLPLLVSSHLMASVDGLSLEERLHSTHRMNIATYVTMLASTATKGQSRTRAQWLTPNTSWAAIWAFSETLGKGRAHDEQEADVIYSTAADFILHARAGKVFSKPLVIKEDFTDRGMHTIELFLTLLEGSCSQSWLDVRRINTKEAASISTHALADFARRPSCVDHGLTVPNLLNLTKAHRPLFTMLPRFRLLETLTERLQGDVGEKTEAFAVNPVPHLGFNDLGLSGAFSGPQVSAACGTWFRNLEGIKYWMIVPETAMASEWGAFKNEGDTWAPGGKERLIVLEEDDVLLIPPGLRAVLAVHSPVSCLMEGGMLWDELSVLEILRSVAWTRENEVITNKAMTYQLPRIVNDLKRMVCARTDRFRGTQSDTQFLEAIESAMQNLEHMGCTCEPPSCGALCKCRESGTRCDVWCLHHGELALSSCKI
ncbi:hypothetical protein LTR49_026500 [Elasticomyces elasticus]|nr:hypothetical protein LTR49_026500 [Elasticomyces elasticus]